MTEHKGPELTSDMVVCQALSKEYSGTRTVQGVQSVRAVQAISVRIPAGAVVALVGPNGAGKSTWMKMVAGLLRPSSGRAFVAGAEVGQDPRRVHAKIGFLPDFFGLIEELPVQDYLDYFARAYGITMAADRKVSIQRVLTQVGLADKATFAITTLSRGMKQRVAIARALINDPPVLLLDEPSAGLDPEARYSLQELFKTLARAGKTLIVSSHILSELETYSTHVMILERGRLVEFGPVGVLTGGAQDPNAGEVSAPGPLRLRLRALGGATSLLQKLRADGFDAQIDPERNQSVRISLTGDLGQVAQLVRKLVQDGEQLVGVELVETTIQDSYLRHMGARQEQQ